MNLPFIFKFMLLNLIFIYNNGVSYGQLIEGETSFRARLESLEKIIHQQDLYIKDQNNRMKHFESLVAKYQNEVHEQRKDLATQTSKIKTLEELTQRQQKALLLTKDKVRDIEVKQDQCGARVVKLESVLKIYENYNTKVPENDSKIPDKVTEWNHERDRRFLVGVTNPPPTMATVFYAYLSHHEIVVGNHQVMIFDTVKTNTNSGYSKFTGVFTAPFSGLYGFTYAIRMGCHTSRILGPFELVRNSVVEAVIFFDNHSCDNQEFNSATSLLHVDQGDKLYIRTHTSHPIDGNVYSDLNGYSFFGGWSIQYD